MRGSHDVEEEVDVGPVEAGEPVQHDDLAVGLVRLREQVLLERALLLDRREHILLKEIIKGRYGVVNRPDYLVVVLCQDPLAVVVHDGDALHGVERRGLQRLMCFSINYSLMT